MNDDIFQIETAAGKMNASKIEMENSIDKLNSIIGEINDLGSESIEMVLGECKETLSILKQENKRLNELADTLNNYAKALKEELN